MKSNKSQTYFWVGDLGNTSRLIKFIFMKVGTKVLAPVAMTSRRRLEHLFLVRFLTVNLFIIATPKDIRY